jgi:hypothetical protein
MYIDDAEGSGSPILYPWADSEGNITISWRYLVKAKAGSHTLTLKGAGSGAKVDYAFKTELPATLPAAPASVNVTNNGTLCVVLSGYTVAEADSYNIYRSATKTLETGEDEAETPIASGVKTTAYTDITVLNGKAYTYSVEAVDKYGNEGGKTASEAITTIQDDTNPTITLSNNVSGNTIKLYAVVTDNVGVTGVDFTYKLSGETVNTDIGSVTGINSGRAKSVTVSKDWDVTQLADATYIITATVTDKNGNTSSREMTVTKRSAALPYTGTVNAGAGALKLTVSWSASTTAS